MERGAYNTNNQPNRATFKYEQEGLFCLGVAKVEDQDKKIIGKRCPVFDYTEKKIVTTNAYKKEMRNELERIRKLTSSSSPWVEKIILTSPCFPIPLSLHTDSQSHILSVLIFSTHGDEDKVRFLILSNSCRISCL